MVFIEASVNMVGLIRIFPKTILATNDVSFPDIDKEDSDDDGIPDDVDTDDDNDGIPDDGEGMKHL